MNKYEIIKLLDKRTTNEKENSKISIRLNLKVKLFEN